MLLNVAAHKVRIWSIKVSKRVCHITYSVTKRTASQTVKCTLHKRFVTVYNLWRCTFCDVYVLKTLRFGTLTLCAATFCNITSCDVYVMLLYVMYQHPCRGRPPPHPPLPSGEGGSCRGRSVDTSGSPAVSAACTGPETGELRCRVVKTGFCRKR